MLSYDPGPIWFNAMANLRGAPPYQRPRMLWEKKTKLTKPPLGSLFNMRRPLFLGVSCKVKQMVREAQTQQIALNKGKARLQIKKIPAANTRATSAAFTAKIQQRLKDLLGLIGPEHSSLARQISGAQTPSLAADLLAFTIHDTEGTTDKYILRTFMYMRWCRSMNITVLPITEAALFQFALSCEKEKAPPTRAPSVLSALKRLTSRFGLANSEDMFSCNAIIGAVKANLRRRGDAREAPALTTEIVILLEKYMIDERHPLSKRVMVGAMLYTMYVRLRWDDATHISEEPWLDPPEIEHNDAIGTIEARSAKTKPNQTVRRMGRKIPMCCWTFGLHSPHLFKIWLQLRKEAGLNATRDKYLIPLVGPDWVLIPGQKMTTSTANIVIKELLRDAGVDPATAARYSSHSLKATTLSWCAKAGVSQPVRRLLGYHLAPGDQIVDLYARHSYIVPLNQMAKTMRWIMSGNLLPDYGAHGRFTPPEQVVYCMNNRDNAGPGDSDPVFCLANLREAEPGEIPEDIHEVCGNQVFSEEGRWQIECQPTELNKQDEDSDVAQEDDDETLETEGTAAYHALEEDNLPLSVVLPEAQSLMRSRPKKQKIVTQSKSAPPVKPRRLVLKRDKDLAPREPSALPALSPTDTARQEPHLMPLKQLSSKMACKSQAASIFPVLPPVPNQTWVCTTANKQEGHREITLAARTPEEFHLLRHKDGQLHWSSDKKVPICPPSLHRSVNYKPATYGTGRMCPNCVEEAERSFNIPAERAEDYIRGRSARTPFEDSIYDPNYHPASRP